MFEEKKESLMSDAESEQIQLYFTGRNLADLDLVTVTDSFLMVYLLEPNKPKRKMLQTKIYWNDLNPDYSETLVTEFFFEIRQMILVEVYHEASPPTLIGTVEASVGEIFGSRQKGLSRDILDKKNRSRGQMIMKCEKVERGTNRFVEFDVKCDDLPSQGFLCFGGSSPMIRLYKMKNGAEYVLYESEVGSGTSPRFKRIALNQKKLCNNDQDQPVVLKAYNYSNFGAPKLIGEATFTVNDLIKGKNHFNIVKEHRTKGSAELRNVKMYTKHEFSDYLMAGMEMALVICVDFTASNGSPNSPNSLHYTGGGRKSQYEQALKGVTNIVMDYDADKLVPTYGFGAKVRMPSFHTGPSVHHCFPLNGNNDNPNLFQLEGIMNGYRECMKYLQFGGPTNFSPLLREAMKQCEQMKQNRKEYMILLILTDGAIHDTEEVMDLLVKCGRLPLSVIIVGIGNGDWGLMHKLDDDDCQMVDFQGNKTQRDLVQFVEFSEHKNNGVELARQVLFQLPRQVEEYNQLVGLTPDDYRHNKAHNDANLQIRRY